MNLSDKINIFLCQNQTIKINKFIYALGNNDIHLCEDIKCEVIEKIDFSIILQDKHNLTKFFLNKVKKSVAKNIFYIYY